jgi:1-acyl-sn-glycerol-3-phosphate acyltransferase
VLGPLMDRYTRCHVAGREDLDDLTGPVVFVANHNSHMDTPVILRALPGRWRRHTAVAAAADYFYDTRRKALSMSLAFGTVPLDRDSGAGVGPDQTAHLDRPISDGGSLIILAEGTRSRDGRAGRAADGCRADGRRAPAGDRADLRVGHRRGDAARTSLDGPQGRPARPASPARAPLRKPIVPRASERPSEVMERVRLFLAECRAETEREPDAEHTHRRQPA